MDVIILILLVANLLFTLVVFMRKDRVLTVNSEVAASAEVLRHLDMGVYKEKMQKYLNKGEEWAAYHVLRNGFINHPGNEQIFSYYIDFLLGKVKGSSELNQRFSYLDEAAGVVVTFAEYCDLSRFSIVKKYKVMIDKLQKELAGLQQKELLAYNEEQLQRLKKIYDRLVAVDELDKVQLALEEAAACETLLKPDFLTEEQSKNYSELKKAYERLATVKGETFTERKYRQYNHDVVKQSQKTFEYFVRHEKDYKKGNRSARELISENGICSVNVNYLNNASSTYFTYIYNYIFSLIQDEEKFAITHAMTIAEKDVLE